MSLVSKTIIVDGSNYVMRAFHAISETTSHTGVPTNAILGVANMMTKLIKENPTSPIIFVLDPGGKTLRHEMFELYKANRPSTPDELKKQIPHIKEIVKSMGIPVIVKEGVEADDIIATLVKKLVARGTKVIISSGDKDICQLVTEDVSVMDTMKDALFDVQGVIDKFSLTPSQLGDFLALMGDKSDNIPGVEGVGQKSAVALLNRFKNLDGILSASEDDFASTDIRGAKNLYKKVHNSIDNLSLSRKLVTLISDIPDLPDIELKPATPDTAKLAEIYKDLDFKKLLNKLDRDFNGKPSKPTINATPAINVSVIREEFAKAKQNFSVIYDIHDLDLFMNGIQNDGGNNPTVIEIDYDGNHIYGFALQHKDVTVYVPTYGTNHDAPSILEAQTNLFEALDESESTREHQLEPQDVVGMLRDWLKSKDFKKICFDAKRIIKAMAPFDIEVQNIDYDVMLGAYLDGFYGAQCQNLGKVASHYISHPVSSKEELLKELKKANSSELPGIESDHISILYCERATAIKLIYKQLMKSENFAINARLMAQIELPATRSIASMEMNGIKLDVNEMKLHDSEIQAQIQQIEQQAYSMAGVEFNLKSPSQVSDILFNRMGLSNPANGTSTSDDILGKMRNQHPIINLIRGHRSLMKLHSSYTGKLPNMVDDQARIHTTYNQALTTTGRLSSSDPNLQNIPMRTESGRRIRTAFVASEGYTIVSADYSQIELRVLAHLSNEPALIEAFKNDADIHALTASEVFGVPYSEVSPDLRRSAKAINFGLIYGLSAKSLAADLGINIQDAQEYMNRYFARFPAVVALLKSIKSYAIMNGHVTTINDRKIHIKNIDSTNRMVHNESLRAAINAPMQGSAADIIKIAMARMDEYIFYTGAPAKMLMQVHDELVFEVKSEFAEVFKEELIDIMSNAVELSVPLKVDAGIGQNYLEAH